ncbi:hypothetical protein F4677DRAFT_389050 [Hypoxylon crocopeplum]|nr:hypothetical protein F4677DRAFT_389050 [Hypoxylon crocopeplum]
MGSPPKPYNTSEPKSNHRSSFSSTTTIRTSRRHAQPTVETVNEIPERQRATPASAPASAPTPASGTQNANQDSFQAPGPGFDHVVKNVPGVGLVYNHEPVNGFNPASGQQQQIHQTLGTSHPIPQVPPPGFTQVGLQCAPGYYQQYPGMAYSNGFMPNQGQNFQPPVPDTTYGPMTHTYHPRFDQNPGSQYVMIGGQIYQVINPQDGTPVRYLPVNQSAPGLATAPIMMQPGIQQQPAYFQAPGQAPIQGQPGIAYVGPPPTMASQPATFPAILGPPGMPGGMPVGMPSGIPAGFPPGAAPDVMGIGKTPNEMRMEQYHIAMNNKALEGQDMSPADPDPSRMYYCRELDGEWTLRNRYSIDHMGDCRWYVLPGGVFYAVRLAD